MATTSKTTASKTATKSAAGREEFKARFFVQSGYPKTLKDHIKMALNLFVNFFG